MIMKTTCCIEIYWDMYSRVIKQYLMDKANRLKAAPESAHNPA